MTKKLRVLLAEDNAVNQKVACCVLEKQGHHVTVAVDGCKALAALDRGHFDVVLMDVQMPEMGDGRVRDHRRHPGPGTRHRHALADYRYDGTRYAGRPGALRRRWDG